MLLTCREPKCIYNNEAPPPTLHTPCHDHRYRWGEDRAVVGYTHIGKCGKEGMVVKGDAQRQAGTRLCARVLQSRLNKTRARAPRVHSAGSGTARPQHEDLTKNVQTTPPTPTPTSTPVKSLKPLDTEHWQPKHVLCLFPSAFDKHKQNILRSSCEDPQRCRS